jgi:hypothetical protein
MRAWGGAAVGLATFQVQEYPFQMTIRRDLKVGDLLRRVADFRIENGMCGNIQFDAEQDEDIDFDRIYQVSEIRPEPASVVVDPPSAQQLLS